jgi:hypothetical protein
MIAERMVQNTTEFLFVLVDRLIALDLILALACAWL